MLTVVFLLLEGQGVDTVLSETGTRQAEAVGQYLRDLTFSNVFASNLQRACQVIIWQLVKENMTTFWTPPGFHSWQSEPSIPVCTADIILRNNTHCSGMEMVLDALLRERGFGIAEGRPKEDLKNMANAAGQSCRDYTPPGGETIDQVRLRFKKFLKVLFQRMSDDHGWSGLSTTAGETEAGAAVNGTTAAVSDVAPGGLADDGLQGVSVHALVVCHGAYIRIAIRHLVENLDCSLPAEVKMSQLLSPCPNTGISRFIFTLSQAESGPVLSAVRCVFTNRKDHLENLKDA